MSIENKLVNPPVNKMDLGENLPVKKSTRKNFLAYLAIFSMLIFVGLSFLYLYKSNPTLTQKVEPFSPEPTKTIQLTKTIIFTKDSPDTLSVFVIAPPINKEIRLFTITKPPKQSSYQPEKETPLLQIADKGSIAYTLTEGGVTSLYYWNEREIKKRYDSQNPFKFSLAPDGKSALILEANEFEDINSKVYDQFEKTDVWEYIVRHNFYIISLEGDLQPQLILSTDVIDKDYDSRSHYKIVDWSWPDRRTPLLQIVADGQLSTKVYGLYFLDFNKRQIWDKYPSVDQTLFDDSIYLTISTDAAYLAYRKPDHACCGGINYSNDQTYILNLANSSETKVFDEYLRYQNTEEEQAWTEQHQTVNLSFSPTKYNVAQTIKHIKFSDKESGYKPLITTSVLVSDIDGKEILMLDGYTLVGWIDDDRIIAAKTKHISKYTYDWEIRDFDSLDEVDITTGEISNIHKGVINRPKLIEEFNPS